MATSQKALDIAAELNSTLQQYFTTVSGILFDSSGNPYFTVTQGSLAAGQQASLVVVKPIDTTATNAIGQAQTVYSPTEIQFVLEQLSGNTGTLVMTGGNLLNLTGSVVWEGTRVSLYLTTNTTAPAATAGVSGTLTKTFYPDAQYKLSTN